MIKAILCTIVAIGAIAMIVIGINGVYNELFKEDKEEPLDKP